MKNHLENFEIEDTHKGEFITSLTMICMVLFIPLIIFIIIIFINPESLSVQNIALIIIIQALMFFLFIISGIVRTYSRNNIPYYRVKFIISSEGIKVLVLNEIFLQYNWIDILKIEVIKESNPSYGRAVNNIKLKLFLTETSKEIRLYVLKFRKKNRHVIIHKLSKFAQSIKKEIIFIEEVEKLPTRNASVSQDIYDLIIFRTRLKAEKVKPKKKARIERIITRYKDYKKNAAERFEEAKKKPRKLWSEYSLTYKILTIVFTIVILIGIILRVINLLEISTPIVWIARILMYGGSIGGWLILHYIGKKETKENSK